MGFGLLAVLKLLAFVALVCCEKSENFDPPTQSLKCARRFFARRHKQATSPPLFAEKKSGGLFFSWVKGGVRGGLNPFSFAIEKFKALEKLTGESL
ncbi:hypothetical protein BJI48_02450 [Helicobacter sp. 11S02596-1]|nr:hypothetical protein BJI48_02450 [Helicobacter sp. 11S02596-1]